MCGESPMGTPEEEQEYIRDSDRIYSLRTPFQQPQKVQNHKTYEKLATEIEKKWYKKNRAYYARLMHAICGSLNSGPQKKWQYELERKYALLALENPDEITLATELSLTGYLVTNTFGSSTPKGEEFAKRREQDIAVRLHAWKRLIGAIDPNWSPDALNIAALEVANMGFIQGMDSKSIKDAALRKKFETAVQCRKQESKNSITQGRLHRQLKAFPKSVEKYIIQRYSHPPFNIAELKKMLDGFPDEKAKARMLSAVAKNIQKKQQEQNENKIVISKNKDITVRAESVTTSDGITVGFRIELINPSLDKNIMCVLPSDISYNFVLD